MKSSDFEKELRRLLQSLRFHIVISTKNQVIEEEIIPDDISESLKINDKTTTENNLKNWIFNIVRGVFINEYKKIMKINTTSWDNQHKLLYYKKRPDELYDINLITKSLSDLSSEEAMLFSLHLKDYTYQEISKETQLPIYIVQTRIHNVHKKLKKMRV